MKRTQLSGENSRSTPRILASRRRFLAALWIAPWPLALACRPREEIVVFHASSLRRVLFDVAKELERTQPGLRVRLEPSGSLVAARKVSELGLRADLVVSSDAGLIDRMLTPNWASFTLEFATNELVLAHKDHSRFTDEIDSRNWVEVLSRDAVRLGRAHPETAPLGYHTLMTWTLAESSTRTAVRSRLEARVAKEHVAADETELLGMLEARAIDYAFLYRSTAEDHRLKITSLPPTLNLSSPELAAEYAEARVRVGEGPSAAELVGGPILYGMTIPKNARNPAGGAKLAALILSETGRGYLERAGFRPLHPATCRLCVGLPQGLRELVAVR